MKRRTKKRSVQSSGVKRSRKFTVEMGPDLMALLSGLYTMIEWALVREYWTNAEDGHAALRKTGVEPPRPISIHVPNTLEPYFEVTDYGIGMDDDTVFNVFTVYGKTTKGKSNLEVGGFGIGGKAAHAYEEGADQWTILSRYNGFLASYTAFKDDHGVPDLITLGDPIPTDEPNGVTVRIPVASKDIEAFRAAITRLALRRLEPFEITGDRVGVRDSKYVAIEYDRSTKFFGWRKRGSGEHGVQAIMGGVPYPVDLRHKELALSSFEINHLDKQGSVDILFKVGELDIVPSREGLRYSSHTVTKLKQRFGKLFAADISTFRNELRSKKTVWEAIELVQNRKNAVALIKNNLASGKKVVMWRGIDITDTPTITFEIDDLIKAHTTPPTDAKIVHIRSNRGSETEKLNDITPGVVPITSTPNTDGKVVVSPQNTSFELTANQFTHSRGGTPRLIIADMGHAISTVRAWWAETWRYSGAKHGYLFVGKGWDAKVLRKVTGFEIGSAKLLTQDFRDMKAFEKEEKRQKYRDRTPAQVRYYHNGWHETAMDLSLGGVYVKLNKGDLDLKFVPKSWKLGSATKRGINQRFGQILAALQEAGVLANTHSVIGIPKTRWKDVENNPDWQDFWSLHWSTVLKLIARAIPENPIQGEHLRNAIKELSYVRVADYIDTSKLPTKSPLLRLMRSVQKKEAEFQTMEERLARFTAIAALRRAVVGSVRGKTLQKQPKGVDIESVKSYNDWLNTRYPMVGAFLTTSRYGGQYTLDTHKQAIEDYMILVDKKVPIVNVPKIT